MGDNRDEWSDMDLIIGFGNHIDPNNVLNIIGII